MLLSKQVNPYLGAFIEGVATLLCRLASRALGELGPKHASILDSFIGTSLVIAGNCQVLLALPRYLANPRSKCSILL